MKWMLTVAVALVCAMGNATHANAAQQWCSPWFAPAVLCDAPAIAWVYYTTPKEHEQKKREEAAKSAPCPSCSAPISGSCSPACHDASLTICVDLARPCYTEQGLKSFAALFSAAAERGVENASIRAFNQVKVEGKDHR